MPQLDPMTGDPIRNNQNFFAANPPPSGAAPPTIPGSMPYIVDAGGNVVPNPAAYAPGVTPPAPSGAATPNGMAPGGATGQMPAGGPYQPSQNRYGNAANLDPSYLRSQVVAAFQKAGNGSPSEDQIGYWVNKALTPDIYSDGKTRVGWNPYWEARLMSGSDSADPNLAGTEGIIGNPSQYGINWGSNSGGAAVPASAGAVGIGDPRLQAQLTPFVAPDMNDPRLTAPTTPFTPPTYEQAQNEPGYKFALDQGLGAFQNSASAKGLLHSGATLKGLNDYASNAAAQNYQNVYNRALATNQNANSLQNQGFNQGLQSTQQTFTNALNANNATNNNALGFGNLGLGVGSLGLQTQNQDFNQGLQTFLANTGQQNTLTNQGLTWAQIVANAGGNYANNATNLTTGQGNANAAGTVGSANAVNYALGNVGNNAMQGSYLAALYGRNGGTA